MSSWKLTIEHTADDGRTAIMTTTNTFNLADAVAKESPCEYLCLAQTASDLVNAIASTDHLSPATNAEKLTLVFFAGDPEGYDDDEPAEDPKATETKEGPFATVTRLSAELAIEKALRMLARYQRTDGDHHKIWIVDQAVRLMTGCSDNDETDAYMDFIDIVGDDWEHGICP